MKVAEILLNNKDIYVIPLDDVDSFIKEYKHST